MSSYILVFCIAFIAGAWVEDIILLREMKKQGFTWLCGKFYTIHLFKPESKPQDSEEEHF